MEELFVFTDGGSRGNPGPAAIGVVIKDEKGKILTQFGKRIGETTNNVAEYSAVIGALKWIGERRKFFGSRINFFLDSSLVVNQLNGLFKMKNRNLRELLIKIRQLEATIGGKVSYQSIPRQKNYLADRLVNQSLTLD